MANENQSLGALAGLRKLVDDLEHERSLRNLDRVRERVETLDRLDAYNLDSQLAHAVPGEGDAALFRRAIELRAELEAVNTRLYENIRKAIRRGDGRNALILWVSRIESEALLRSDANRHRAADSYDHLDEVVSGVLRFAAPGEAAVELAPEMVAYQPTPVRHIFDLIRRTRLTARDVFIDLGSGLGHVSLIVAACTQARAIGIEIEPSYVDRARQCAEALKLDNAVFFAQDAREADLSRGTTFYLYTPFHGAILRAVLDRLRLAATAREIRVCAFGPCTPIVDAEAWLMFDSAESGHISVFRSRIQARPSAHSA
jgi:predicted RNA methylase